MFAEWEFNGPTVSNIITAVNFLKSSISGKQVTCTLILNKNNISIKNKLPNVIILVNIMCI